MPQPDSGVASNDLEISLLKNQLAVVSREVVFEKRSLFHLTIPHLLSQIRCITDRIESCLSSNVVDGFNVQETLTAR